MNRLRRPLIGELDPYRVFLANAAITSLALTLVFTVNMIYQAQTVGLGPLQLVLVGTTLELTAFIFEIPTGVVADVYSRRLSVIIGALLIGVGFIVEGTIRTFGGVLLAQVIWGIGWTFTSGATDAWIADEIGEEPAARAYLRASQVGQLAAAVGIVASVAIASLELHYAIIAGGATQIGAGVFLLLFMPEKGFSPASREERETFSALFETSRQGLRVIRGRQVLMIIMAATFVFGAASESFDRLWTLHLLENFTFPWAGELNPVIWFGVIGFVSLLIGTGITEFIRRRVNTDQQSAIAQALIRINTAIIVLIVAFALIQHFVVAILLYWLISPLRGVNYPLRTAWVNQRLDSSVRATVLSMASQTDAIGQVTGGPVIGYVGNLFGVRAALAAGGLALAPILGLYGWAARRVQDVGSQTVNVVP